MRRGGCLNRRQLDESENHGCNGSRIHGPTCWYTCLAIHTFLYYNKEHQTNGEMIMSAGQLFTKLFENPVNTAITVLTVVIVIELVKYFINRK